ncbi:UNVERIFIED_CONTAM: hypothetical protein Slati_1863400 [Sesamum latifolium]|uniref:RNase H type-1 domain-containing protein n=1 Tax=Sesamum latifolium TaxID=2727402 RepID=A0AAW2X079_9LAMI
MRFQSTRRSLLGIHGDLERNRGNPLKIKAIIDMKAPTCLNEAQRLTGRIAALSRFISKSAEKSLPFFKMLRKAKTFEWGEALYLYLSAAPQAVSSVLIREEDGKNYLYTTNDGDNHKGGISRSEVVLHVDGSSTAQGSGAGIVITTPQCEDLEFAIKFGFKASNNEAEYEALVIGLRMAHETGAKHLLAYSDSQLVVKQVEGTYEAKEESMIQYLQQIADLKTKFHHFQIIQIPREENAKADSLSKLASSLEDAGQDTSPYIISLRPGPPLAVQPITTGEDWRTPIIK